MAGPCDSVNRLLSPYVDDALAGADRAVVEGHLRDCKDCQGRLADLQATRATLGAYFSAQADRVDFSGFSQRVMAQIRKEPLPFGQRVRLWWTELMAYHSAAIYSGFGAAAVAAAAVLVLAGGPGKQAQPNDPSVIRSLNVTDPRYEPVVMHTDDGETITLMVEHEDGPDDAPAPAEAPHGGNL